MTKINSLLKMGHLSFFFTKFAKASSVRDVTLTAAHLDSFLNFAQLAYMEKFKTEPKYPAVIESPRNEVALTRACLKDWFSFVNQKKCGKPETGGRRWAKTRLKIRQSKINSRSVAGPMGQMNR